MPFFHSYNCDIAFSDTGEGRPIVLVHGFGSNKETNWLGTGWVKWLTGHGFRVIMLDNRGHGASSKPHDPDLYAPLDMAEDALRLMDHLGVPVADVMGYSMGGRLTVELALAHPDRVRTAIVGGMGIHMVRGTSYADHIAAALEAPSADDVADPRWRGYRIFADRTKSDRLALAACIRGVRAKVPAEALAAMKLPVLVAVGTEDLTAGSGPELAALIPGAESLDIPGRDHMAAVGDRTYKDGALKFLQQHQ